MTPAKRATLRLFSLVPLNRITDPVLAADRRTSVEDAREALRALMVRCGQGVEPFWCQRELGHEGDHFARVETPDA